MTDLLHDGYHKFFCNIQTVKHEKLNHKLLDELPELQVEKARKLLAKNDTEAAKQAFADIVDKGTPSMALV